MANNSPTEPEPQRIPGSAAASGSSTGAWLLTIDDDIFDSPVGSSIGDADATGRLASTYSPGKIVTSGEMFRCRRFQVGYRGCISDVGDLLGKVGTVVRVDSDGDVHVSFSRVREWCLCFEPVKSSADALLRTIDDNIGSHFFHMSRCSIGEAATTEKVAATYSRGEKVKISGEMFGCRSSQVAYRGYSDDMGAYKLGTVEVDFNGDVHVSFRSGEKLFSSSEDFAPVKSSERTWLWMRDGGPAENFFRLFLTSLEEFAAPRRIETLHNRLSVELGNLHERQVFLDRYAALESIRNQHNRYSVELGNLHETQVFRDRCAALESIRNQHGRYSVEMGNLHERQVFPDCYAAQESILNQESCNVDVTNAYGETPLLRAAHEDCWGIVESLVFAGADINTADRHRNTALHICLMNMDKHPIKRVDMPTSLVMKTVEKRIREHQEAEVSRRLLVACFLARFGADIRSPNKETKTPLQIALNLEEPAVELLGFSAVEGCFADNGDGECRCYPEETWHTSFRPRNDCGCVYCRDCRPRMKRCRNCGLFIGMVSKYRSATLEPKDEKKKVIPATEPMRGPKIYKMEKKPRGMCIIINNTDFQDASKQKEGSYLDVENMEFLFKALHFNVSVKTNLDAGDMLLEFVRASYAKEQQHADCLVVILMSCGGEEVICGVDGKKLKLHSQVYSLFNNSNCPGLKGKPKLFFIQFCRGSDSGDGTEDVPGPSDTYPTAGERSAATFSQRYNQMPFCSDMYIAHATIPGYVALKNKPIGSWFLSAVNEVFSEHACKTHLEGLMAQVIERCSFNGSQQTPRVIKAGWEKQLYFNPGI